jgi:predicted DNA-binding ribbon-helix-helix protein
MRRRPKGKSLVVRRHASLNNRNTKVTVETAFWDALKEIADSKNRTLSTLLSRIDKKRQNPNFSSAIRLFVLNHYVRRAKRKSNDRRRQAGLAVQTARDHHG